MGVNSLPKTATRQRCDCDLNSGPFAPESSTLTTWLTSHPNNNYDSVYGAIAMTKVIARVHPVHLMNADWALGGRQASDKLIDLGCESAENWQLPPTSTIAIVIIINTKNCSLSIVLTATNQKPQRIIKKVILPTITLPECQRDAE